MRDNRAMHVRFGDFLLDTNRRELSRGDEMIHVERQVYELLTFLIENADRVVSKDEIMDVVWKGQIVSESAITSRIRSARMAIGDDGREQALIKTVHGIGYRFIGAIAILESADEPESEAPPPAETVGATADHQVRSHATRPSKLLVGRASDCAAMAERIAARRMVTLIGPGGIGKTHLLMHLGAEWHGDYRDGSVFVALADVRQDEAVAAACLDALGVRARSAEQTDEALLHALQDLEILVILDNAEQVRDSVAALAARILERCPGVTLLCSSRTRLGVSGEAVHTLGPLDDHDARDLFVEHARAHGVELEPESDDLLDICKKLDGVPLALELASARTRLLSLRDVAARLSHHLSNASVVEDGDGRHRSVEAALAWSLDALDPQDRRVLRDLCVFAGAFDVDAASAVADVADATDVLMRLADRSLVVALPTSESSAFRLLEPIRLFGAVPGAEMEAARRRHLAFFIARAEAAQCHIASPDIDDGIGTFHTDWPNLRVAFAYASETQDVDAKARLILAVDDYAELRLHREVLDWARETRLEAPPDAESHGAIVGIEARLACQLGDHARAQSLAPILESAPQTTTVAMARAWLAFYSADREQLEVQLAYLLDEVDRGRERGYRLLAIYSFDIFGSAMRGMRADASADAIRALGTPSETHRAFRAMADGFLALWARDPREAISHLELATERYDQLGYALLAISASAFRTAVLATTDDEDAIRRAQIDTLRLCVRAGRTSMLAVDFARAATLLANKGDAAAAARLVAAARRSPSPFNDTDRNTQALRERLESHLGPAYDEATRAGLETPLLETARLAIARLEALDG